MKLYKDVLTPSTLSVIHREFNNFMETPEKWTPSNFRWDAGIRINVSGTTLVTTISDGIVGMILEDLEYILPPMDHRKMQYCVWLPNSGISTHTDASYKFGATIYLNETWDPNDGGIFMYQNDGDDWRANIPSFNTMIINDSGSLHLVTPVSAFAKHNRYTIQIFGDKINE